STKPHLKQVREAAKLLATARRPVLYAGGGAIRSRATAELLRLVNLSAAPAVTTLMARGAIPASHPQHIGLPALHGNGPPVAALHAADPFTALGCPLAGRLPGRPDPFPPDATIGPADSAPAEIAKHRRADVPIVRGVEEVGAGLTVELEKHHEQHGLPD